MKKIETLQLIAITSLLYSCNLADPADCRSGQEKCTDNELSLGIYYVCGPDGNWASPMACKSACDKNTCAEFADTGSCETEGESQCLTIEDISLSLYCHNHQWVVSACMGTCENNKCTQSESGCTEGERRCAFVEPLELSVELTCSNKQWVSSPCAHGLVCNGDHCGQPKTSLTCSKDEHVYNNTCEKDDIDHCGDHETRCVATISGATAICDSQKGCGNQCPVDKSTVCNNTCTDIQTDTNHCGGCGLPCTKPNASAIKCEAGICKATECSEGVLYNDDCLVNIDTKSDHEQSE